ncbi:hypothetical protein PDK09_27215 [Bacillus cereus]|nr:hypothetical protein [Bacillus cereus]MDA1769630.1 hypothetical protein [Bacillus cereus]
MVYRQRYAIEINLREEKKEVVIPNATYWVVDEKTQDVLFKEVLNFIKMKEGIKE